jgi:hypothetical protein
MRWGETMNIGRLKTKYTRFMAYVSMFTMPNTLLLLMGIQFPFYIILPIEVLPAIVISYFDMKFIFKQESNYTLENAPMFVEMVDDIKAIRKRVEAKP